jgi:hypothetical protein
MKKFSTQVLGVALGMFLGAAAFAQPLELAKDAPDKYVVVKGDTLWDISGRFLQKPWRWPEIWQLNREQISNPHLIYPGDIVYLDTSGGSPRLRLGKPVGGSAGTTTVAQTDERVERAGPSVRSEPIAPEPVPTINAQAIEAFLSRPLIVDPAGLATHPRIVATQDGRVYLSRGELAYVRGVNDDSVTDWHIYRSARPILDPDTRLPIAYEAEFVGTAKLERAGDPATFRIVATTEEVGPGDRLMPADHSAVLTYAPRPPASEVNGRIVSIYRGVAQAARNSVVALNVGSANGLEVGHVLEIKEHGRVVPDRQTRELIRLPSEPIGHLLVFRTFDKIAYGLIMKSSRDVGIGDDVSNP